MHSAPSAWRDCSWFKNLVESTEANNRSCSCDNKNVLIHIITTKSYISKIKQTKLRKLLFKKSTSQIYNKWTHIEENNGGWIICIRQRGNLVIKRQNQGRCCEEGWDSLEEVSWDDDSPIVKTPIVVLHLTASFHEGDGVCGSTPRRSTPLLPSPSPSWPLWSYHYHPYC